MTLRMTYADAAERLGTRDRRKIGNNTYLERRDESTVALVLHATDVVTFRPGTVTVDSGGWRTMTTKDRIGYAVLLYAQAGTWKVGTWQDPSPLVFYDGLTFTDAGELVGEPVADPTAEHKKVKRAITEFARLCSVTLEQGMPVPGAGDCFYCQMRTDDGATLGDSFSDCEHLRLHMEEGYVVPSLLYNAVAEKGYRYPTVILGWSGADADTMGGRGAHGTMVRAAVRDYMKRRLLPDETGGRPVAGPNRSQGYAVR